MTHPASQRALEGLQAFFSTPLDALLERHRHESPEENAVRLFRAAAESVPAYQTFLREQGIDPASIRTFADFQRLPCTTKENYLYQHSLAALCRDGRLEACDMIAVSSGSTGAPTFWPRFLTDEFQTTARFEQVFHDSFRADERRTLAVVCFALGTWVGGMYTASCCRHLAAKGYPITVITPGNNREEILRVVQELGPQFEQTVLLGYPPFLKDVIDAGRARGIGWSQYRVKLVTAGEVFSEEWRSLIGERTGAENPCLDSASLYGTADGGVLGNETPLSICIRRWLAQNPDAARELFGESRLPTLVQYDPISRLFERVDGRLVFTGDNGAPLIRYNILDTGGIIPFEAMRSFLAERGFDMEAEARRTGARTVRSLPFVFVFGRSNFAVSYFGANVYPENIAVGLEQPDIREWTTGKFVLEVKEDADRNPFLSVTVELAPGVEAGEEMRKAVTSSILTHLIRMNSEFAHYVPEEYQPPQVTLLPTGDPEYFPVGVKHRYTRR